MATKKWNQMKKADKQKKSKTTSVLDQQHRKISNKFQTSQTNQMSQSMLYGKQPDVHLLDETVTAIGGKDTSLFLFRALGKILYCKSKCILIVKAMISSFMVQYAKRRNLHNGKPIKRFEGNSLNGVMHILLSVAGDPTSSDAELIPAHLSQHARNKLLFCPEVEE